MDAYDCKMCAYFCLVIAYYKTIIPKKAVWVNYLSLESAFGKKKKNNKDKHEI
jgi:hypothetical protein